MGSDDAMDSEDGMSEDGVPDEHDPGLLSMSEEDEDMSLSEDDDGNIVSKKPVARRGTTATRSRARASSRGEPSKPAASKKSRPALKRSSEKPVTRRTRAKPQAVPNLIRKRAVGVFESSSEEEDNVPSYSRNLDFRDLALKEDHVNRHAPLPRVLQAHCPLHVGPYFAAPY